MSLTCVQKVIKNSTSYITFPEVENIAILHVSVKKTKYIEA